MSPQNNLVADFNPADFNQQDFPTANITAPVGGLPTALSVVTAALKKAGLWSIGTTPDGSDISDALSDLNDMLAAWNEERWMVWHLIDVAFVANNTTPFTVGPNGNFNVFPRPTRIEYAYTRQLNVAGTPIDTPLAVTHAREDYSRLALKGLVAFPKSAFYDAASPMGNLFVYPIPNASIYEIHIVLRDTWPVVIGANTSFANFPPHAIPAMKFNLARILRQAYGKGRNPDNELNTLAAGYLETLRNSQTQVPELLMPKLLVRPGLYNIFSDQTYS